MSDQLAATSSSWTPGVGRPDLPARGVILRLRSERSWETVWRCDHRHDSESEAVTCAALALSAYIARGES